MKLIPSENKTKSGSWNNFNSDTINDFIKKHKPEFVDVVSNSDGFNCWENREDTIVIQLPNLVKWDMVEDVQRLGADEFDWDNVDGQSVVIRMWWD